MDYTNIKKIIKIDFFNIDSEKETVIEAVNRHLENGWILLGFSLQEDVYLLGLSKLDSAE